MFSAQTYAARREELRAKLRATGARGIVVLLGNAEAPRNYPGNPYAMRQDSTFLYYFGLTRHDLAAILDIDANTETLYGDDYTVDDFIWMGPQPSIVDQGLSVGVVNTNEFKKITADVALAINKGRSVHILPPYRADNMRLMSTLLGINAQEVAVNVSESLIEAVVSQREVKSDEEIAQIEDACSIGYTMHSTAMKMCHAGTSERLIAGCMEGIAHQYGEGVSFHSIVSQNGETLHNHSHDGILTEGRMLLVDAGAENNMNYCSDFTRTIPVNGRFTDRQKDIYRIVYQANQTGHRLARQGVTYQSVHVDVVMQMAEGLKALGLMRGDLRDSVMAGAPALFMPHGLGHQMGLDVHDMEDLGERFVGYNRLVQRSSVAGLSSLRMGKELREGHVITVEPGIYFIPALIEKWESEGRCLEYINYAKVKEYIGFGGIRLEDDILITSTGSRQLGVQQLPIAIEDVEAFVQNS